MIEFTNGKTITNTEAAALIRAEPDGLIADYLIDKDGHRCAGGVLLNIQLYPHTHSWPTHSGSKLWDRMVIANNSFVGTLAERREFMARWFENLVEEEPRR